MAKLRFRISISLDGFVAGPKQSEENPLGVGGMGLHQWAFELAAWRAAHGQEGGEVNASSEVIERSNENIGAQLMGRNMFGGGPGEWGEEPWTGWWGDEPPFHMPVFVLTHHQREPLQLGDTTFHFLTEDVGSALAEAKQAAGGKDVLLAGGAAIARQCIAAGLVDEMLLSLVPIVLGSGERLFEGLGPSDPGFEQVGAVEAPGVTHLSYRRR